MANTIQTGIKTNETNMTDYALFMGGTNVINEVLQVYDPLKTGYGRIFMVRKPQFLIDSTTGIPTKFNRFKHILEYGNTAVQGLNDVSVNFNSIQGGYNGKPFELPSYASDDTNSFSINVYEFSGSPIRETIHFWINGTTDLLTGLSHYNGSTLAKIQANQTAEFIYISTDNTGEKIEYACLLANCFPRGINTDAFNYTAGEHNLVETNVEFSCTKYESIQINKVAQALLSKYKILANSMNFYSGFNANTIVGSGSNNVYGSGLGYNPKTGKLDQASTNLDTRSAKDATYWN